MTLSNREAAYSGEYKNLISGEKSNVTELAEHYAELSVAQEEVDAIEPPTVYTLTRADNAGYASFEQDSTIIENISVVFPVFFFLVAALVCVTTMTRMIEEQRTQIGELKAMLCDNLQLCRRACLLL